MPDLEYADATELIEVLNEDRRPVAVIAGAWLSLPLPSAIPDAWHWKHHLISSLSRAGQWPDPEHQASMIEHLSRLGTGEDLKLERVLEAIETQRPGSSARIVRLVAQGDPNPLHHHLTSLLATGAVTSIVTPNFDELIEAAAPGTTTWTTGDGPPVRAEVMHVHGRASDPASLRHVLSRFTRTFPDDEHQLVSSILADEVVCLAWAGTDPDLQAALAEGTGTVHMLIAGDHPAEDTRAIMTTLAGHRPVVLYRGGFETMAGSEFPQLELPDDADFAPAGAAIAQEVSALDTAGARRAYVSLSFEYSIGVQHEHDHACLLEEWRRVGNSTGTERHLYTLSVAEHAQATGRPHVAFVLNLAEFLRTHDALLVSEAGDAFERIWHGYVLGRGPMGYLFQTLSIALYHRSGTIPPPWVRARLARTLLRLGRDRRAVRILDEILASPHDLDIWVRAHAHRLRAIGIASHQPDWRQDIDSAVELFQFAARSLEAGSAFRASALCEMLEGRPGWRDRAVKALEQARTHYERASDASAPALLRSQERMLRELGRRWVPTEPGRRLGASLLKHL